MVRQNIASFRLGRYLTEAPFIRADNWNETWRIAVGAKGKLADRWNWDAYYTRGEGNTRVENQNVLIHRNFHAAVDAVRDASGNIVCRSTLSGFDAGCVPFNIFGEGSPSAAAVDHVIGDSFRDLTLTQDVAAATVSGELFSLWSDPIGVAFGLEYRKETAEQSVDAISSSIVSAAGLRGFPAGLVGQRGGFYVSNPQPIAGEFDIREGFVELAVPIVRDMPGFNLLEVNGAARLTDYSTSGSVTTWKVGVTYEPAPGLRARATRSRDIRAPNIAELFTGSTQSTGQLRDPTTGATVQFVGNTTGNPDLDPEIADTFTAGVVIQPAAMPGFSFSADYYDIQIDGAIASLGAQATLDECARGSQVACAQIEVVAGIYRVRLPQLNLQSLSTSGWDLESSYRTDFGDGQLTLRALANYTSKFVTITPGAAAIDRAGEVGGSSYPHWTATFSANWQRGPLSIYLQERFIDGGTYDATFVEGLDIDDNSIPAVWYTDITIRYGFEVRGHDVEAFATINNLLNKNPPVAPNVAGSTSRATNFGLYDALGRYYTTGLRFRF